MIQKIDFFVVGAMRSGTSTINQSLRQHPDVFMLRNEPKFFKSWDGVDPSALADYHAKFDWNPKYAVRGEKSAPYGPSKKARDLIWQYNPAAKIVWLLRDPVKRAISHFYRAFAASGDKALSLREAIFNKYVLEHSDSMHAYVYRSEYAKQLEMWERRFPKDQIHWMIFEELMDDPILEMDRLCAFLGVQPYGDIYPEKSNSQSKATVEGQFRLPIEEEVVLELRKVLRPDVEKLFEKIGRRVSHWQIDPDQ